jgi:hypothetical protein
MINTNNIDDNEFARYLTSYIKLMENKIIYTTSKSGYQGGMSGYIDEDNLYIIIKEYMENLP